MKFLRALLPLLGTALLVGAAAPTVRTITVGNLLYARLSDIALRHKLGMAEKNGRWEFAGGGKRIVVTPGRREFFFDGVKVVTGFAPLKKSGTGYIANVDWLKSLRPLLEPVASTPGRRIATITIDAGHGGSDRGTSGRSAVEKTLTLRLALRVGAILRNCGYRVRFSRIDDKFVSLGDRALAHRRSGADLFVSLHFNSHPNRDISGIETFALTPVGLPSSNGGDVATRRCPGNVTDNDNLLLAYHIQRALLLRTKAVDRGVKRARFAVLRDISTPGALVELGFLSNGAEEQRILRQDHFEKLARGVAEGIISYHRAVWRKQQ